MKSLELFLNLFRHTDKALVTVLNFASGLESEFAIADPSICVFRVWFSKSDVLVDLFRPNETFEHILAKKIIM